MSKPLRKSITLPICGDDVDVDVTFEVIEIVERIYDMRAEYVAAQLQKPVRILRKDLADVVAAWCLGRSRHSRTEIRESVITADGDTLNRYIGAIQAAILYSLREISDAEFEALSRGKDIEDDDSDAAKKKPTSDSSESATA